MDGKEIHARQGGTCTARRYKGHRGGAWTTRKYVDSQEVHCQWRRYMISDAVHGQKFSPCRSVCLSCPTISPPPPPGGWHDCEMHASHSGKN